MSARLGSAFCVAMLAFTCGKEKVPDTVEESLRVKTITLETTEIPRTIECFGNIVFNKKIELTSSVAGTIERLKVNEGQAVKAGQTLAVLGNKQLALQRTQADSRIASVRASLSLAQARLWEGERGVEGRLIEIEKYEAEITQKLLEMTESERSLANKEELFKIGGVSEESITALRVQVSSVRNDVESLRKDIAIRRIGLRTDDLTHRGIKPSSDAVELGRQLVALNTETLRAELEVAKAALSLAVSDRASTEELIRELTVIAPGSGIIGGKYVETGEYIPERTKLFTIIDTASVYATLSVQEAEAQPLREGQLADLRIDAIETGNIQGRIQWISPMADPQTGSFLVKVLLPNSSGSLKPGMFVRASIVYGSPLKAVLVPEGCLLQKKNSTARVIVIVNQRAFKKDVIIGGQEAGDYIVESGLSAGDVLVISPSPAIREGMHVLAE
jgi:HlyD family secretion protein